MTIERAADIVRALRDKDFRDEAIDLFTHFVDHFDLSDEAESRQMTTTAFAQLCGYPVVTSAYICPDKLDA